MRSENCAGDLNARITDRIKVDLRKNFLEANLDEEYDMKKILYYNWTPLDSPDGGGVAVYQRNLINSLGGYDVTYLNSGYTYTFDKKLRLIEKTYPDYPDIKAFEVVNSPVLAPVQQSIKNIDIYLHDESLYKLIRNFIISQGGFDVIHFNNLEGLSLKVLSLKKDFPDTAFIYSVHNYFPVCTNSTCGKMRRRARDIIATKGILRSAQHVIKAGVTKEKSPRRLQIATRTKIKQNGSH